VIPLASSELTGSRPFLFESFLTLGTVGLLYLTLRLHGNHQATSKAAKGPPTITEIKKTRFDLLGGILVILFVALPLLALNLGGAVVPWGHPAVVSLFSSTPIVLALLLYVETRLAVSPIFPARLVTSIPALLVIFPAIMVVFAWNQVQKTFDLTGASLTCG
jgi:hypothetical protein